MVIILFLFCIVILLVSTVWIINLYKQISCKQISLDQISTKVRLANKPSFNLTIYAVLNKENEIKYRIKDNWNGNPFWDQPRKNSLCKYQLLDTDDKLEEFSTIPETEDYLSKLILNKFTEINKDVNVKTIQFE